MNVALYVASQVTDTTAGVHQLNVYVYCASASLLGAACVGTNQYSTVVVPISESSSFNHVMV